MELTTKYSVGDIVYRKKKAYKDYRRVPCLTCEATGHVRLADFEDKWAECPDCNGFRDVGVEFPVPEVAEALTIGQVRVTTQNRTDRGAKEVQYMCKETGVGSGTLHWEQNLWPTPEEALNSEVYVG